MCRRVAEALVARGAAVCLERAAARALGWPGGGMPLEMLAAAGCRLAVVFGGDGTLLRTARVFAPAGVPILGVKVGRLGFLTEVGWPEVEAYYDRLLAGEYRVEPRMMIEARVVRGGEELARCRGLNDAVITRRTFARIIQIEAHVGEEPVTAYVGDGLIVATPTGSTAYSLAAGGPICHPGVETLILTPICPHALGNRPLLIGAQERVRVRVKGPDREMMLTVDGQVSFPLNSGDDVVVARAEVETRLVRLQQESFYRRLRSRLWEAPG